MERPQYLIDTNAVIDFLGAKLPAKGTMFMNAILDAVPNLSIITKIELLGYPVQDEHYQTLLNFINDSIVIALNNEIADACIEIRKASKTKLPDSIIAATALVNHLALITRNTSDFKNINGLQVINPHDL